MRKNTPSRLNTHSLIACGALLSIDLLLLLQPSASAQFDCPNIPKNNAPFWEPNHPVTVVFQENSNWTNEEIGVMKKAFDNWTKVNNTAGNNSGVSFVGFDRGPAPDKNTATHTVIVRRLAGHGNPSMGTVANTSSGGYAAVGFLEWDSSVNFFPSWDTAGLGITGTTSHEIGHSFSLGDCYTCRNTIMCSACGIYEPTNCDNCKVNLYCEYTPLPGCPTPTPPPAEACQINGGNWNFTTNFCCYYGEPENPYIAGGGYLCEICNDGIDNDCDGATDQESAPCYNCHPSPITIDVLGDGLNLSSASDGVMFDIAGNGRLKRLSWIQGDDA